VNRKTRNVEPFITRKILVDFTMWPEFPNDSRKGKVCRWDPL